MREPIEGRVIPCAVVAPSLIPTRSGDRVKTDKCDRLRLARLPIFEGRVPFPVKSIHNFILRLLYQATMHLEGHLKAINMLADSLERRINTSQENKYLLNMLALEKNLYSQLDQLEWRASG